MRSAPCTTRSPGHGLPAFLAFIDANATPAVLGAQLDRSMNSWGSSRNGVSRKYQDGPEGGTSVFCSDSDNPGSFHAWSAAAAASETQFGYFGRLWTWV